MGAKFRTTGGGTGYGSGLWPVLLSLLVVLLPTACVLWFLSEAVQNERLAFRQKLVDAYRDRLPELRDRTESYWRGLASSLETETAESPGTAFPACVGDGLADSVVCYDAAGQLLYPVPANNSDERPMDDADWAEAGRLENAQNDPAAAAAYGRIAASTSNVRLTARALQAEARCLARAGRGEEAILVLADTLGQEEYSHTLDDQGRLIAADAQLRALELLGDRTRPEFGPIADRLAKCLNDYSTPLMASAQRRFLMKELRRLTNGTAVFPTLAAEELAATYLDQPAAQQRQLMKQLRLLTAGAAVLPALGVEEAKAASSESNRPSTDGSLRPSGLANVWQLASPDGRVVALLRTESVLQQIAELTAVDRLPHEVQVAVWPPEREPTGTVAYLLSVGPKMPGWRLSLSLSDGEGSNAASDRQVAAYIWIAVLVIATMSIVAVAVAGAFRRQVRLTRLKNDLLATVSHELKTPLSSIRLLVDTLLDAEQLDVAKSRDYLRLVAKENARLSHLIDNFLSFSRMERGKQTFDLAEVSAAAIAQRAVEAAGDRFQTPNCRLEVRTEPAPAIMADRDALVTAVLNLLENAYKYSGDSKRIVLRTYAENGNVCFAVSDNGIGLSARAARKVFRPFYQADRHLSRETGGCGLGLSIVQFIVAAHGGTVRVDSRPGQGSTFTLAVPCAPTTDIPSKGNI